MTAPIEAAPTAETAPEPQPQAQPEQQPEAPKPSDTLDFWKQKAREQEARAKANADAAKRLQEIEDRDKSELQKANEAAQRASTELEQLRRTSLQQQVALEKGIPAALVASLQGASVEEMQQHADALLAWRNAAAPAVPAGPAGPRPDLSQGATPPNPKVTDDAEFQAFQARLFPNQRK